MKKIICLTLSLLMLMSLLSVSAFAEEEFCETFTFDNTSVDKRNLEGIVFKFSTESLPNDGWYAGGHKDWIKIEAKGGNVVTIDRVEARIKRYSGSFVKIGFSSGKKTGIPKNEGYYGIISEINASSFEFKGGPDSVVFDEIKIFYHYGAPEVAQSDTPDPVIPDSPSDTSDVVPPDSPTEASLPDTSTDTPMPDVPTDTPAAIQSDTSVTENLNCETFTYSLTAMKAKDGEIFKLSVGNISLNGWNGGTTNDWIKIEAKNGQNVTIDRIEAKVKSLSQNFENAGISSGNKTGIPAKSGDYGVVSEINEPNFEFSGGSKYVKFDKIKVYYHYNTSSTGSTISEGNVWILAGIGIAAVVAITAIVISKRKKKTA